MPAAIGEGVGGLLRWGGICNAIKNALKLRDIC